MMSDVSDVVSQWPMLLLRTVNVSVSKGRLLHGQRCCLFPIPIGGRSDFQEQTRFDSRRPNNAEFFPVKPGISRRAGSNGGAREQEDEKPRRASRIVISERHS
ncbi:uncharacterized protein LOC143143703 [Ptiloglossa arizonensis]|uniref:uncharacterized protein LOC143143703 n=1 Tax=Ptiloglossa arizonensis TaxID=3350558 RepID=UPI003F9FFE8A